MVELVLVVAPHPDDESIGCGGTICLHRQQGDRVQVVFLTSGERGMGDMAEGTARALRESEAELAGNVLQLDRLDFLRLPDLALSDHIELGARQLQDILDRQFPSLVYLPHPDEAHPDHQAALAMVRTALLPFASQTALPELRLYEVWTPMTTYGWPEDITLVIRQKLRAIRCYRSQLQTFRYDRAIRGLNQYRGALAAHCRYAEVFQYATPYSLAAEIA